MGFIWDLIQQSQISDQRAQADSLEERVRRLEQELDATRQLVHQLLVRLEERFGEDLNGDGRIG
ncbi:MAG TPA: hypothetical protein PKH31_05570 [Candidatus Sumerlaeota bacterium]|nr:hypothetical protein [Candidatus Sumerlaeota bacterium]